MQKKTFKKIAEEVLEKTKEPSTAAEIWNYALNKGMSKALQSRGKSPWETLEAVLSISVREDKKSIFDRTADRPFRYYLKKNKPFTLFENESKKTIQPKPSPQINTNSINTETFKEKDLHPFLSYFANKSSIHTKTIDHTLSTKEDPFGEWTHPDIVGVKILYSSAEFESMKNLEFMHEQLMFNLYSYELKIFLNENNLIQSYSQAIFNSSWANEGYLVACYITKNSTFRKELFRLSSLHGIGVIHLDLESPDKSEILFPAGYKSSPHALTIKKMAMKNHDFADFIKELRNILKTDKLNNDFFDKILTTQQLAVSLVHH